jgi:hypothetical protein
MSSYQEPLLFFSTSKKSCYRFLVFVLIVFPLVAACSKILSSDSGRALELLETLVVEPGNQAKLGEVTLNQAWSTENILPLVHGNNTLRYLRARIKQDQSLEYRSSRKTVLNDGRSYVEVTVSESSPGVLHKKKSRYVFRVFFKEDKNGNTVITHCENLN